MTLSRDTRTQPDELLSVVARRFEQSMRVPEHFFTAESEQIARACWSMARRFHQGGRLLAFGTGALATDAQHVSVEFVHPVIVGKRALPAIALTNDAASLSGLMTDERHDSAFSRQLRVLARPQDIALGFLSDSHISSVIVALQEARRMGLLTLALAGSYGEEAITQLQRATYGTEAFYFVVPSRDSLAVQETHETLYHILWELVHVFFEHEGILK